MHSPGSKLSDKVPIQPSHNAYKLDHPSTSKSMNQSLEENHHCVQSDTFISPSPDLQSQDPKNFDFHPFSPKDFGMRASWFLFTLAFLAVISNADEFTNPCKRSDFSSGSSVTMRAAAHSHKLLISSKFALLVVSISFGHPLAAD